MRRLTVVAAAAVALMAVSAAHAEPGLALSLRPGLLVNGAQVGVNTGALFAGAGLEFASASVSSKYAYNYGETTYTNTSKYDLSVFLPQLAVRYAFGGGDGESEAGTARPYAGASIFYSLATAKVTYDGERDTTMEKSLIDVLGGNFGGTAAFGGEYFIAQGLSLTGELGCRFMFGGTKVENEWSGYAETYSTNLGLGLTYTTLGLTFYF